MNFKKVKTIVLILALSTAVVGCGNQSTGESSRENSTSVVSNEDNVLVYGSNDYDQINPALYEHGEINSLIFSGLTAHDENNNIVMSLAKDYEYNENDLTYTFNLRDDVLWHDGEKFTANDVKFTLEAILNPDNQSEIVSNYEDITDIEIINDYTIKLTLKSKNVAILDYLTVGILPKHLLEGKNLATDSFNQNPIGTGPFKLEEWDIGQSITLVKNEDYFNGDVGLDGVIFKIVEDSKAKVLQLKSGELDLAQVTAKDIENFKDNEKFGINILKTADYRGIMYNFSKPLFKDNKELPNALSYGIDRQKIVDSILLGYGEVAYSPIQMGEYNNESMEKFEYNPEKARVELENAGWIKNNDGIYEKNGTSLAFEIICSENDQVRIDMANICAQQLNEIGANVTVSVESKIDWSNEDSYLVGWGSPFDPDDHTYKVFKTDEASNYNFYSNSQVDEFLIKARETNNKEERLGYYKDFQDALTEEMPYTFIAYIDAIYVGDSNISGISDRTVLGHHGVGIFWNIAEWTIE